MTRSTLMALAVTVGFAAPGTLAGQTHAHHDSPGTGKDLVQVAMEAGSFTTLLRAVEAAGLVEVLRGEGPFTVFAPTDEAFARLPEGVLRGLLADPERLAAVLTYHVVPGRVTSGDVLRMGGARPESVQGQRLTIAVREGRVHVDGATVVAADVMASNGVIHVIDAVVLPQAGGSAAAAH
jgi:uncharacterized surface protein with fasciclin (FAS1) repeats